MTTDTFTNVTGRNVVSSGTAEPIGSVKGFVLDPSGSTIEAIHVDGHGKRAVVLRWSDVHAFGADAVMATVGAEPFTIEDDHQRAAVKGVVSMLGSRVLTASGREVGTVHDVEFDVGTGAVVRVVTDHEAVEADRLRSLGSYALVVDDTSHRSPSAPPSPLPPPPPPGR